MGSLTSRTKPDNQEEIQQNKDKKYKEINNIINIRIIHIREINSQS